MMQNVGMGAQVAEQVGSAGQSLGMIAPPAPAPAVIGGEGGAPTGAPAAPPSGGAAAASAPPAASGGGLPAGIDLNSALAALGGGDMAGGPVPQGGGNVDPEEAKEIKRMLRAIMMRLDKIEDTVGKPKKITIQRKDGKITGASASAE
jgi:hypothetical protein